MTVADGSVAVLRFPSEETIRKIDENRIKHYELDIDQPNSIHAPQYMMTHHRLLGFFLLGKRAVIAA